VKPTDPCTQHALAEGRCCRVDRCDHGTVHLTIGAMTLRLSPEQLVDLSETLATAAERVRSGRCERVGRLLC
jgi:hypothetical protein